MPLGNLPSIPTKTRLTTSHGGGENIVAARQIPDQIPDTEQQAEHGQAPPWGNKLTNGNTDKAATSTDHLKYASIAEPHCTVSYLTPRHNPKNSSEGSPTNEVTAAPLTAHHDLVNPTFQNTEEFPAHTRNDVPSSASQSDIPSTRTQTVTRCASVPEESAVIKPTNRREKQLVPRQFSTISGLGDGEQCVDGLKMAPRFWRGNVTVLPAQDTEVIQRVVRKPTPFTEVEESMCCLPITRALRRGEHRLVLECLRQGENPHVVCSQTGQTFLHLVTWCPNTENELRWVPIIYQLSNAGVNIDKKDNKETSPALVAIRRKLLHVLSALLKCGAELGPTELEEAEGVRGVFRADILEVVRRFTPTYWQAVLDPTSFKVKRLTKAWTRINTSRNGQTLLEFAKQNAKDQDVVRILSQNEASIELAHAVMAGDCDRARVLLCDGSVDLGTTDCSVRSASLGALSPLSLVDWSEKLGHSEMSKLLRDRIYGPPDCCGENKSFSVDAEMGQRLLAESNETTSVLCRIL